jgi:hypothetical protein
LIQKLEEIKNRGWIPSRRSRSNVGSVGNTLEDLLGIRENNLPLANAGIWELKAQRRDTQSLTTLFHCEPEPRKCRVVPEILLPRYGWLHKDIPGEKSFRVTMSGNRYTDRGFRVIVNWEDRKVYVDFNAEYVSQIHMNWLKGVEGKVGLGQINPQPYWEFDTLEKKARQKLHNIVYVIADSRRGRREEFYYGEVWFLEEFRFEKFLQAIENGIVLIDFDARTHHNHGTKFRIRDAREMWTAFYDKVTRVI